MRLIDRLPRYKGTPAWVNDARRLWEAGLPVREVAARVGRHVNTVDIYKARDGWTRTREAKRGPKPAPRRPKVERPMLLFRQCFSCRQDKPLEDFPFKRDRRRQHLELRRDYRCRECQRIRGRCQSQRIVEHDDGTITPAVLRRMYRTAHACPYCETPLTRENRSIDHMTPLARGGVHGVSNILICCIECNVRKSDMPFAEWMAQIGRAA